MPRPARFDGSSAGCVPQAEPCERGAVALPRLVTASQGLLDRIDDRRERLQREHGMFDTLPMIQDLRDNGGRWDVSFVLDCSVAVKWFVPEPLSWIASSVLDTFRLCTTHMSTFYDALYVALAARPSGTAAGLLATTRTVTESSSAIAAEARTTATPAASSRARGCE